VGYPCIQFIIPFVFINIVGLSFILSICPHSLLGVATLQGEHWSVVADRRHNGTRPSDLGETFFILQSSQPPLTPSLAQTDSLHFPPQASGRDVRQGAGEGTRWLSSPGKRKRHSSLAAEPQKEKISGSQFNYSRDNRCVNIIIWNRGNPIVCPRTFQGSEPLTNC